MMHRSLSVTGWAAAAACATAAFAATAAHALAAVRAGELVRGPAWAVVLVLSVAGLLLTVRVLLAVGAAAAGAMLATLAPYGLGAHRSQVLAVTLAPRMLRPLLCGALVAGAAVAVTPTALAAAPTASAATTAATVASATTVATTASHATASHATAAHATAAHATGAHAAALLGDDLPAPGWPALSGDGWRPDAPAARAHPGVELVTSASTRCRPDGEVVVRRGDTLWDLAARSLGPGASDADVAAAWPRWWHANRDAIGADPDLLLPGTRLCAPPESRTARP